jgi:hypothetical protein
MEQFCGAIENWQNPRCSGVCQAKLAMRKDGLSNLNFSKPLQDGCRSSIDVSPMGFGTVF